MLGTKLSWRGARARVLRLSDTSLSTHDPTNNRPTNTWPLAEVVSAEVHGLVLKLRFGGACAMCGLISPKLSFSMPDAQSATAMCAAIRAQLCRVISRESSEVHKVEMQEEMGEAVLEPLDASPPPVAASRSAPELSVATPGEETQPSPGKQPPEGPMQFDVSITINKARGLPLPPLFYSNPIVECMWGVSDGVSGSSQDLTPTVVRPEAAGSSAGGPGDMDMLQVLGGTSHGSRLRGGAGDMALAGVSSSARVLFRTEPAPNHAANPRWGDEACFRYSATPAQLQSRLLVLRLVHARPLLPHAEAGRTQVRLHDIAVGPTKFDLPVHDGAGREVGRIVFTIRMMQKCELAVSVPAATVVMRGGARHTSQASQEAAARSGAFSLTAALTVGEEGESEPIRTDFDQATLRLLEAFNMELSLPPGGARSAIHVLASATSLETESLHLRVWRGAGADALREGGGHKSRLVGEVWLPLTKVYTPGDHAEEVREFSDVLWLHGQRVGRLAGCVRVLNGPRVVQVARPRRPSRLRANLRSPTPPPLPHLLVQA